MQLLAATIVLIGGLLGVGLTLMTLPGIWVMLLVAVACKWWQPDMLSWWTLGAAVGLAVIAEIIEFVAAAAGAAKVGGTRAGAVGAIVGTLVGLIAGSMVFPIVGTIIGAVVGAGIGAAVAERGIAHRSWSESAKSGTGAAVGRVASIFIKGSIAVVVAVMLSVDAFWS